MSMQTPDKLSRASVIRCAAYLQRMSAAIGFPQEAPGLTYRRHTLSGHRTARSQLRLLALSAATLWLGLGGCSGGGATG